MRKRTWSEHTLGWERIEHAQEPEGGQASLESEAFLLHISSMTLAGFREQRKPQRFLSRTGMC